MYNHTPKGFPEPMTNMIIKAAQFAAKAHEGQVRKYNGRPYITHPVRVAGRVATHRDATESMVAAAFLHDVVEDCGVSIEVIAHEFHAYVAAYVNKLTNKSKGQGLNRAQRKQADKEKIRNACPAVKIIKLIDRIDNLLEIDPNDPFSKMYAVESLDLLEVLEDADAELADEYRELAKGLL